MLRVAAIAITTVILAACGPAEPTPAPEATVTTPASVTPAAQADTTAPAAPMTWEAMQDHYRQIEVEPTDPLEALEMRAVLCSHFSGEIGSEDAEREQFLNARMEKHRCGDTLVAEARAMRDARSAEPAVVARLNTILAELA